MPPTITLLEAWGQWFSGNTVPGQAELWGVSVLWWGRIGKALAFLAGATVILDIIGPERLREWSRRKEDVEAAAGWFGMALFVPLFGAGTFFVLWLFDESTSHVPPLLSIMFGLVTFVVYLAVYLILDTSIKLGEQFARLLDRPRPAQAIRIGGAALLVIGFHFDLLAS